MNRLPRVKRATVLHMLVEGSSQRSISRITGVNLNTVSKLLVDAGNACADYHDEAVRSVRSRHVQVDEVWSFTYAKQKNVATAKAAPPDAGDTWTWTALDADTKLMVTWYVGPRHAGSAYTFLRDLAGRLAVKPQITSDGLSVYEAAMEDVFGASVDYAQLVKLYGSPGEQEQRRYSPAHCRGAIRRPISGNPDPAHIHTSHVERQNLNIRMGVRRFTRLTNAFSKKLANHCHHVALYMTFFNFCRVHKTLRVTPAMAAGLAGEVRDVDWLVDLIEARQPKPGPRGPYRKRAKTPA